MDLLNPSKALKTYWHELSLSFSGWRRVFAFDRDENNSTRLITQLDADFLKIVAKIIKDKLLHNLDLNSVVSTKLVVGMDSRPTGPALEAVMKEVWKTDLDRFVFLGVVSLPQCLAYVKNTKEMVGMIYFTASHNPVGHNGIKLGDAEGKMISAELNLALVQEVEKQFFAQTLPTPSSKYLEPAVIPVVNSESNPDNNDVFSASTKAYRNLMNVVMSGGDNEVMSELEIMKSFLADQNFSVACDFNGSSRLRSYDDAFYREWGISLNAINDVVGEFNHGMVPEGESLEPLKLAMETMLEEEQPLLFGLAVDCDGDRGNLVLVDEGKKIILPDAQSTFALSVLSELVFLKVFFPEKLSSLVVVVNGPTSLRVDLLCQKFGVDVVRAEVGEINVITLANQLIAQGKEIRIIGEGSNGGNITFPSTVRDPLTTVASILKLLFLKKGNKSLLEEALKVLGLTSSYNENRVAGVLVKLIESLHQFYSTDLFSKAARVDLKSDDQMKLKNQYEALWEEYFHRHYEDLKKDFDVLDYQFVNYEGTETRIGKGNRKEGSGGLKVSLFDQAKKEIGYLWFRGSKTEKLLRVSSEYKNELGQQKLLTLQKELLKKADEKVDKAIPNENI